jgi:penicillin-insensitive murein endopeptidase
VRSAVLAFATLASALSLSPGALPFGAPAALLRPQALAGVVGQHATVDGARGALLGPSALRFGRSLGSPTEGRLIGGAHLDDAPYLRIVPAYAAGDVRWGLEPLVALLERAARAVHRQFPDAVLSVGHLSQAGGGDIERHRSHESGRDADVSFLVRAASGRPLLPSRFVPFRADGAAPTWPGAYFDDARNWALVAAMVQDPEAHVTHIFIASPLRARLLAYAERLGVAPAVRVRAAETMQQPHGALPHDDHFHVRIGCPPRMSGCVENPAVRMARAPAASPEHGRRGPLPQRLLVSAPKRALPPAPGSGAAADPRPTVGPPVGPTPVDPGDAIDVDPGSEPPPPLPTTRAPPVDDVDG